MARRHQQHQAVDLATFDALELLGDLMMERRRLGNEDK